MKQCSVCKDIKKYDMFVKNVSKKDGLSCRCKECDKKKRLLNREKIKENNKRYRLLNNDKIKENNKKYKSLNRDKYKKQDKIYYQKNKDKIKEYNKKYRLLNGDKLREISKNYRLLNKQKIKDYNNKKQSKYNKNKWEKTNRKNKPWYYAHRDLLNRLVKNIIYKKNNSTPIELGYTAVDLKIHIENLFIDDMSWQNYGSWHIDHIYPISKFDKNTKACIINALTNLRPLWKIDNLKKSNKILM